MKKMMILNDKKLKQWSNFHLSSDLFKYFYMDIKNWKEATKDTLGIDEIYPFLKECESIPKEDIPIFKLDPTLLKDVNLKDFNFKKVVFPFKYLFIETPIYIKHEKDVLTIGGFLVINSIEKDIEILRFYYVKGWAFKNEFHFGFGFDANWRASGGTQFPSPGEIKLRGHMTEELTKEISMILRDRILGLLYLISKKEYSSYKKYTEHGYVHKEIVNSRKVMSHKRHFWKDSGRFKIPLMSKEELSEKGYEIDEIVVRDGEIRMNVPYTIIGESQTKGRINKKSIKKREFLSKRQLRKENELFNILQKIFPKEYIKRHDRKRLKGLELDFYIHSLRLAFEYDGEQHFDRHLCEDVFKSDFNALKKRDRKKDKLCRKLGIKLIRIKYSDNLNISSIKRLLK